MGKRRNYYNYSEYKGRNGGRARTVLLFIIVLLAVLLAAGLAFTMLVDLEYTPTGVKINWPWMQESGALPDPTVSNPPPVLESFEVGLIVESVPPATASVEPDPTPTPVPEPEYGAIGAVTVTPAQLRAGTAAQAVSAAGGSALVVEMKGVTGKLAWQSETELAGILGANAANSQTSDAVRALDQGSGLYLVAKVQCFRDPLLAAAQIGALKTPSGRLWHDTQGVNWSSPASEQAVDYLSALCLELADMGFDEILLDHAGYPNFGELFALGTDANRPEDLTIPVSAFLQRIHDELAERGVRLGVLTDETLAPGDAVNSGIDAWVLAGSAGRVWLSGNASASQYSALLTNAGWSEFAPRLVNRNGAAVSGGSWYR